MDISLKRIITADDVIRAGACASGVYDVIARIASHVAAAMPVDAVLKLVGASNHDYVVNAARLDCDGEGYGDGYGNDDGYGFGDGYGYGFGFGDGYGFGDGEGYGFGFGDGYGFGDGEGYGFGDGYGNGNGDGEGYGDARTLDDNSYRATAVDELTQQAQDDGVYDD